MGRGLIHDDRKLEARAILQCLFDESVRKDSCGKIHRIKFNQIVEKGRMI